MISTAFVMALAIIALVVSVLQYLNGHKQASITWWFIVFYWVVLTIKNVYELTQF